MGWEVWVVVAAASLALQLITILMRRQARDLIGYVALMAANFALLVYAHVTQRDGSLLGEVGTSLALVMLLGPMLVDQWERRALARDDLPSALRAVRLHELLVPGRTSTRRRRQLQNLVEARAGGAAPVLARLAREIAVATEPLEAASLHEESATVRFMAQQFAEGVAEAERFLPEDWAARHPAFGAYLVRAYGELDRLERAGESLRLVEGGVAARDPGALGLLTQARITLLAYAGRSADVDRLLAGEAGLLVSARAKQFLHDVARARHDLLNRGSNSSNIGSNSSSIAASASDGAAKPANGGVFAVGVSLPGDGARSSNGGSNVSNGGSNVPNGGARAATLGLTERFLDEVAGRAAESARPIARPRPQARVTMFLIVLNVAAAIASKALMHEPPATQLVRAGALFGPAVHAGEWWRAFSAMFLHAELVHLAVNMIGMFMLGRFCEEIMGSLRFFVVYVAGGLAGAVGSLLVHQQMPLSVGASGAVMGLLGAIIVVLVLRRGVWPEVWRRTLLWNLVLLGAVQIYVGFEVPLIDNGAHVGGMLGGAATALLVAPGGLFGRSPWARAVVLAMAMAGAAGIVWAGVQVGRTSLLDTFKRIPTKPMTVAEDGGSSGAVTVRVPAYWELDRETRAAVDPYLGLQFPPHGETWDPEPRRVLDWIAKSRRSP